MTQGVEWMFCRAEGGRRKEARRRRAWDILAKVGVSERVSRGRLNNALEVSHSRWLHDVA